MISFAMQRLLLSVVCLCAVLSALSEVRYDLTNTITATLTDSVLTVEGYGAIPDYTSSDDGKCRPWVHARGKIKECYVGEGITAIGNNFMYNSGNLRIVVLPETIVKIGDNAFYGCINLRKINIPSSLQTIGRWAFRSSKITDVYIPQSVDSIGLSVFSECDSIKSMTICNKYVINRIPLLFNLESYHGSDWQEYDYVSKAPKIQKITLLSDSIDLRKSWFRQSNPRENGSYKRGHEGYYVSDVLKADTVIVSNCEYLWVEDIYGGNTVTNYPIFGSAKVINLDLSKLDIEVFKKNSHYSTLFSGLPVIEYCGPYISPFNSFIGYKLRIIKLNDGISVLPKQSIGEQSELKTIYFPDGLLAIEAGAMTKAYSLTDIYVDCKYPPVATDESINGVNYFACTLNVPSGSKEYYKQAEFWKNFYNINEYDAEEASTEQVVEKFSVSVDNSRIIINADDESDIRIYDSYGISIPYEHRDNGIFMTPVLEKGIYVVNVDGETIKLLN